ncbi:Gx transporter family protein [Ectothiorhodospiraceae bacterium 2226]|nr:Gx transporter family protein [Ectothiorhodospiraceae bacterium 2226]
MRSLRSEPYDHRIAWLAALALAIHVAESALPSPLPGVKPGLANVITVAVLCLYGWRAAAWVSVLRVLAGGLVLGTFLSPTFLLSAAGAAASLAVLWLAQFAPGRGFGPLGYSVLAALGHMAGQFYLAYWVFIPHPALHALLPILMTAAFVLGVANGIIAAAMLRRLARA